MDNSYNGWSSHATWMIALHIDNTQEMQADALDITQDAQRTGAGVDTRYAVSEAIKELVESWTVVDYDITPTPIQLMQQDMVQSVLSDVNWYEIADHYITKVTEGAT